MNWKKYMENYAVVNLYYLHKIFGLINGNYKPNIYNLHKIFGLINGNYKPFSTIFSNCFVRGISCTVQDLEQISENWETIQ